MVGELGAVVERNGPFLKNIIGNDLQCHKRRVSRYASLLKLLDMYLIQQ